MGPLFLPAYLQTVNSLPHASWSLGGRPCWGAAWGLDISRKAARLYTTNGGLFIQSLLSPPMEVTVYSLCAISTNEVTVYSLFAISTNGGHCIQSLCYLHQWRSLYTVSVLSPPMEVTVYSIFVLCPPMQVTV